MSYQKLCKNNVCLVITDKKPDKELCKQILNEIFTSSRKWFCAIGEFSGEWENITDRLFVDELIDNNITETEENCLLTVSCDSLSEAIALFDNPDDIIIYCDNDITYNFAVNELSKSFKNIKTTKVVID